MAQSNKRISAWYPVLLAACFAVGLFVGSVFLGRYGKESTTFTKLHDLMNLITNEYVDQVNTDSLLEKAMPDIMAQLDPHTAYIPAEDLQQVNEELEGSFSGIGIQFNMMTDTITVLEVISGGPSELVGLLPGDRIIEINDTMVAGMEWTQERVLKTLRGPKGSEVKLGIKRSNSAELLPFTVTRGDIPVTSIDATYMIDGETGYLKINKFGRTTFAEFLNSMVKLQSDGAKKYIIDLRGNGGGFMEPAVMMANEFLDRGQTIVTTKGRKSDMNSELQADGSGSFKEAPLTVILDEFSASASEIFAGAIQDNDRGVIVGRRSFGKGLVQNQFDLPDHSAIRLTVARYYTPSGRCIQKTYALGHNDSYQNEIIERFAHGESFSADSMKIDKSQIFHTASGREVYGGGGIVPDIYVPSDTTGITPYYVSVFNAGMIQKYAFSYTDRNRERLSKFQSADQLLAALPSDDTILQDFADFCRRSGKIAPRWFYINISRDLIVSQLKALIARDILGSSAYFEVFNRSDNTVSRAIEEISRDNALLSSPEHR